MQIVIDIPDKVYGLIKYFESALDSDYKTGDDVGAILIKAVLNGTPLPDGAEILTKEAYSDLCKRAAEQPEKRTETHACVCISRQAVDTLVDELARAMSDERCHIQRGRSTATIMSDILDLPPVEPERKPGKWIDVPQYGGILFECDFCHKYQGTIKYKYCPNCGAKMVEPQESEGEE